ncbi:peptidase S9 [Longibacter salinarum]|uniref:Peptidase S9 n=1 Tax=Longibacter salinarum TaxID=1850348 RepID=A0A2A8D1S1_9BACT|nr:S9 family peptidase [Longibacter salinarum]PEN14757.1 peptidase S9 [Longibacter salinarum]
MKRLLIGLLVFAWVTAAPTAVTAQQAASLPDQAVSAEAYEGEDSVLSPKDIAKIKQVGDAVLSPDGKHVAYTLSVPADPTKANEPAKSQLWVANVETGETTPFATRGNVRDLAVRPGHRSLTFIDQLGDAETSRLYEIPLGGGEATELYSFETSISGYDWGPDGERIAFYASDPDAEDVESELPYQPEIYEEDLTFSRGYIGTVSDTSTMRIDTDRSVSGVTWSPDGSRLAILSAPTPRVDDYYMSREIGIVDPSSGEVVGTVEHDAKLGGLSFSPDGSRLAFIAGGDIHDPIDGRLFVVSSEGGTPTALMDEFEGKVESVRWADAQTIEFLASEGVHATLGRIQHDGSGMERVISGDGPVLHSLDAANGIHAFVADTPTHPREVYVMMDGTPERLTNHNAWLDDERMAPQEVVTYTAEDGQELQGLLIHPLDREEGKTYPLITVVHGGPEAHYDDGWLTGYSMPGQMGAARGYAVFYPNYRGSTGRGEAFAKSSQGDLAGKEFDDIVDGVDALIERGLVDVDRVGVTGGSYGGYATGWMSTRYTDRFAAGVMFVGVSNNISKWGESDIPEELYLVHARKRIWDDYMGYLERSPIYHAGDADTPLLILHGKEDPRVHPSQSLELYRHIKTRTDTPVRLVYYPGEGHGNRSATARFDYNIRMLRWFDRFLTPDAGAIGAR